MKSRKFRCLIVLFGLLMSAFVQAAITTNPAAVASQPAAPHSGANDFAVTLVTTQGREAGRVQHAASGIHERTATVPIVLAATSGSGTPQFAKDQASEFVLILLGALMVGTVATRRFLQ